MDLNNSDSKRTAVNVPAIATSAPLSAAFTQFRRPTRSGPTGAVTITTTQSSHRKHKARDEAFETHALVSKENIIRIRSAERQQKLLQRRAVVIVGSHHESKTATTEASASSSSSGSGARTIGVAGSVNDEPDITMNQQSVTEGMVQYDATNTVLSKIVENYEAIIVKSQQQQDDMTISPSAVVEMWRASAPLLTIGMAKSVHVTCPDVLVKWLDTPILDRVVATMRMGCTLELCNTAPVGIPSKSEFDVLNLLLSTIKWIESIVVSIGEEDTKVLALKCIRANVLKLVESALMHIPCLSIRRYVEGGLSNDDIHPWKSFRNDPNVKARNPTPGDVFEVLEKDIQIRAFAIVDSLAHDNPDVVFKDFYCTAFLRMLNPDIPKRLLRSSLRVLVKLACLRPPILIEPTFDIIASLDDDPKTVLLAAEIVNSAVTADVVMSKLVTTPTTTTPVIPWILQVLAKDVESSQSSIASSSSSASGESCYIKCIVDMMLKLRKYEDSGHVTEDGHEHPNEIMTTACLIVDNMLQLQNMAIAQALLNANLVEACHRILVMKSKKPPMREIRRLILSILSRLVSVDPRVASYVFQFVPIKPKKAYIGDHLSIGKLLSSHAIGGSFGGVPLFFEKGKPAWLKEMMVIAMHTLCTITRCLDDTVMNIMGNEIVRSSCVQWCEVLDQMLRDRDTSNEAAGLDMLVWLNKQKCVVPHRSAIYKEFSETHTHMWANDRVSQLVLDTRNNNSILLEQWRQASSWFTSQTGTTLSSSSSTGPTTTTTAVDEEEDSLWAEGSRQPISASFNSFSFGTTSQHAVSSMTLSSVVSSAFSSAFSSPFSSPFTSVTTASSPFAFATAMSQASSSSSSSLSSTSTYSPFSTFSYGLNGFQ